MWLALLVGVLCNNIIGMLWYSPLMFMNTFLETNKIKTTDCNYSASVMAACNVLALMECFGLYYAFQVVGVRSIADGIKYGALIWQFFLFPALAVHYLFDRRPAKHLLMVAGHHLASMVIEGAVIAMLK